MDSIQYFIPFDVDVSAISLPERFTYPFYYSPHPLCVAASKQIQNAISKKDWQHNFGLNEVEGSSGIGKMFGVLVVQSPDDSLGFLAAFSGKIADSNHHDPFVPPVYDMLSDQGFFKKEEAQISKLNNRIEALLSDATYLKHKQNLHEAEIESAVELSELKSKIKQGKANRKQKRANATNGLNEMERTSFEKRLVKQSLDDQYTFKRAAKKWKEQLGQLGSLVREIDDEIESLKKQRKARSKALQKRLFESYRFLNSSGETATLLDIFKGSDIGIPPTGAGECAAPKLLQYAFKNRLKPVAMAEFWWGKATRQEVRNHMQFYPSCRGKCEPILGHMLRGLDMDPNPLIEKLNAEKAIEILFEDEHMLVINKPPDLLSVPGKDFSDSVYARMRSLYPDAKGPIVVHRLDMSTSGIMLLAKTKEAHKHLQQQFERRKVKKRYVALLDGVLSDNSGQIDLPLRVDFYDRPRQLVCHELGKRAFTKWELLAVENGRSRVQFYPHTGRTHQLRVHAAHIDGLGIAIVGDELYGQSGSRLHLHADRITFTQPNTEEEITIECKAGF